MRCRSHSRITRRSPNTRSNNGLMDSMSMSVSWTSKTNTVGRPGKGEGTLSSPMPKTRRATRFRFQAEEFGSHDAKSPQRITCLRYGSRDAQMGYWGRSATRTEPYCCASGDRRTKVGDESMADRTLVASVSGSTRPGAVSVRYLLISSSAVVQRTAGGSQNYRRGRRSRSLFR
jgi:hypothetical protein